MTVTGEEGRDGLSSPRPVVTLAPAPAFDYGRFQACLDRTCTRSSLSRAARLRAHCSLGTRRDEAGEPTQLVAWRRNEGRDVHDAGLRARDLHRDEVDVDAYALHGRDGAVGDGVRSAGRERHAPERHETDRRALELTAETDAKTLLAGLAGPTPPRGARVRARRVDGRSRRHVLGAGGEVRRLAPPGEREIGLVESRAVEVAASSRRRVGDERRVEVSRAQEHRLRTSLVPGRE